jgi:hypothetical protein
MAATETHVTTEEMLEVAFSVWSVPRLYNEDQLSFEESLETALRRVVSSTEITASLGVSQLEQ